jgi:hypothetical protein
MVDNREYHFGMGALNRAAVAALTFFLMWSFVALSAAQTSHTSTALGASPSVSSIGFGGRGNAPRGLPPSVNSIGFGRNGPGRVGVPPNHAHHPRDFSRSRGAYYFPYAYPYVVDGPPVGAYDETDDDDSYNSGPTIFDRRGSGSDYSEQRSNVRESRVANTQPNTEPEAETKPQPPTVLVFKDGHQVEVANYAIVGTTLYDLSDSRRWKIALADLDLPATTKQNDDRGLDFQVPSSAQAN